MNHFSEISASAERVVDAAETLVQQVGYNGFSYDDIANIHAERHALAVDVRVVAALEGALVVGRRMHGARGPAAVSKAFLSALTR